MVVIAGESGAANLKRDEIIKRLIMRWRTGSYPQLSRSSSAYSCMASLWVDSGNN